MPESLGGLPAGAPPPPATPYQYPAVHDMPPPRATEPMSAEEQLRLEQDLTAARKRQEGHPDGVKKPAKAVKKKPNKPDAGDTAGAKTNP